MNTYENAVPKPLKFLISDGKMIDDAGNVIAESETLKDLYTKWNPEIKKYLLSDGSVVDENNNLIIKNDYYKKMYEQADPKVAKYLHADGTIDENAGGGSGANLENNKIVSIMENGTVEITPSTGYDGMKKVTATVNVSGGGGTSFDITSKISGFTNEGYFIFIYDTDGNPITTIEDVKTKPLGAVCVMAYDYSTTVAISDLEQYFPSVYNNEPAYDSESDSLYYDGNASNKIDYCGDVSNWTLSEQLITKLIMYRYS